MILDVAKKIKRMQQNLQKGKEADGEYLLILVSDVENLKIVLSGLIHIN